MLLTLALGALAAASCAYCLAAVASMAGFRRRPPGDAGPPRPPPSASLLKPAVEPGPGFRELLRSHAAQDHPDFEILVGVRPGDEETAGAVGRVQAEFPATRIEAVECPEQGPRLNGKAEVLGRLAQHSSNAVWVVTDADIRVPRHHLRTVCTELDTPGTGLVTCLYRGEPGGGLVSRLEAIRIDTEFPAQVLLARRLQGVRFALGATLAFRRKTLERLGGFRTLQGFVGDDYTLGAMVAGEGLGVKLSSVPVATRTGQGDGPVQVWDRQLRWSRTIRKQRPAGHAGLAVSFATVWCCLALVVAPAALWPLAALAAASRLAAAVMSARTVGNAAVARDLWLVPFADIAAFTVWVCSYFGNEVKWAGRRMRLGPGGRIKP